MLKYNGEIGAANNLLSIVVWQRKQHVWMRPPKPRPANLPVLLSRYSEGCFIYILDCSNSSSITFLTSQFSSSSRSNWTGIWTFARKCDKKIILGTSDAWSLRPLVYETILPSTQQPRDCWRLLDFNRICFAMRNSYAGQRNNNSSSATLFWFHLFIG